MNRFIFLNLESNKRSRTRNYFNSLVKLGYRCEWFDFENAFSFDTFVKLHRLRSQFESTQFVITSPSHILIFPYILVLRKKVIFDAGWPLLDGVISSRKQFGIFGVNLIKTFLIDFFAFHLASKIVLESDEQIIYTSKTFAIPKRKISSLFTGFDEERFNNIDFTEIPVSNEVNEQFHILFRGGNQVESGLELLKNSLRENVLPSNIRLTILSKGLENGGFGYSATVISKEISDRELFCVFLACNLVLGQMSGHERLDRTIPHKFFEAAFFGKAYLTAPFGPMKNFVDKQIVQYFDPTEVDGLFTKIVALSGDVDGMESLGDRFRGWYESNASSEILGKKFLAISRSI